MKKVKILLTISLVFMLGMIMTSCGDKVTYDPPEEEINLAQQALYTLPVENGGMWYYTMYETIDGERKEVVEDENAVFAVEKKTPDEIAEETEEKAEKAENKKQDKDKTDKEEDKAQENVLITLRAQNKGTCELELSYYEAGSNKCKLTYTLKSSMDGQISILDEKKESIDKGYKVSNLNGPVITQQSAVKSEQ